LFLKKKTKFTLRGKKQTNKQKQTKQTNKQTPYLVAQVYNQTPKDKIKR